jgi:hypothetical protein
MTGGVGDSRHKAADRAFEQYDFGTAVEASDGWESLRPGTYMTRRVYLTDDERAEAPTVPCWFTVVFRNVASDEVAEAYAMNAHGSVFGTLKESGAAASADACQECGEADCPGLATCPVCGTDDHGADAFTLIADHGRCWACHKAWQLEPTASEAA